MTESKNTAESIQNNISRDWQISNPSPVYIPQYKKGNQSFNFDLFKLYNQFINEILPMYEVDVNSIPSAACQFLQKAVDVDCETPFMYQMLVRAFILACQKEMLRLITHPNLIKASLIHNELVNASEMIKKRSLSQEIVNMCDMMLADVLDLYHSSFSDAIETKFWAKTKTGDDLIEQFLKKEIERIRLLSPYTFKMISSVMMKKSIDSAPTSSVERLNQWAAENGLIYE